MRLTSLRRGFATNSSSTHSVILLPDIKDDLVNDPGCYGWEPFTLSSDEQKQRYIAQQLFKSLQFPVEVSALLTKAWTGVEKESDMRRGVLILVFSTVLVVSLMFWIKSMTEREWSLAFAGSLTVGAWLGALLVVFTDKERGGE